MSDTNDLQGSLKYAQIIATVASIGGSIWLLYSCCKPPRPSRQRDDLVILVGAMAIADLIFTFPNILSIVNLPTLCSVEGFTRQLYMVSMCLVTSVAILCFLKKREPPGGGPTSQRCFVYGAIIASIFVSLLFASLPMFIPTWFNYGGTNVHCWITSPQEGGRILVVLIFEIIPVLLGSLITIYFYLRAMKISDDTLGSFATKKFKRQFLYPFFLFFVFVPSIIDDITAATTNNKDGQRFQGIEMVHILLTHSIGLTNALLYKIQDLGIFSKNQAGLSMQENT